MAEKLTQTSQIVRRNPDTFRPAWERWPYPATFGGDEFLTVIGFPGKNGKLKKFRMDGIVEVVVHRSGKRATVWRFAPWVGRALGPNPGENLTEGKV